MKQAFTDDAHKFKPATLATIAQANEIIAEYQAQGFVLTLRQIYYQFVARDLVANTEKSYNRIGDILNKGRLAGLIDWAAIEDRTRSVTNWIRRKDPKQALEVALNNYGIDMWKNQPTRVEVWIEKEALAGVIHDVCGENDVPYFACRGYVSQSEQWRAGRRVKNDRQIRKQKTIVLHLGDHDPSGIDMTRDNADRLDLFNNTGSTKVRRIALTEEQIAEYGPPPNPAKMTDSRFEAYAAEFGDESWELDALDPPVLVALIQSHIDNIRDPELWQEREDQLEMDEAVLREFIEGLEE